VRIDCTLGLCKTQRYKDSFFVAVDYFSKMDQFIACNKTNDVTHVIMLFFEEVMRLHGIPRSFTSYSDANFLSHLWKKMGTKIKYMITCHPQTDGQIEITNRSLGTLLRALTKSNAKAWDLLLPHTKFAYNKAPSKTMGMSLFGVAYGIDLLSPLDLVAKATDKKPSVEGSKRMDSKA